MAKNETAEPESDSGDAPLIDLNDVAIKKLLARAKKRGVITYDELNEALPQDQMSSEQIEDVMSAISEMGVNIVEAAEASDDDEDEKEEKKSLYNTDEGEEELDAACEQGYMRLRARRVRLTSKMMWMLRQYAR